MSVPVVTKKVKEAIKAKNLNISVLGKMFQEMDTDHDSYISAEDDLPKFFKGLNIKLLTREMRTMVKILDPDDTEKISITSFLAFFAPEIDKKRLQAVEEAFKTLDASGNEVTAEMLRERFGKGEYTVIGGRRVRTEQLLKDITDAFDRDRDGKFTKTEFVNYYKMLSEDIPDDNEFIEMVKASWAF